MHEFSNCDGRLDLDIISGEILCLTGPNGSGKSTLLETPRTLEIGEVVYSSNHQSIPIKFKSRRTPVPGLSIALQTDGACLDETVIETQDCIHGRREITGR